MAFGTELNKCLNLKAFDDSDVPFGSCRPLLQATTVVNTMSPGRGFKFTVLYCNIQLFMHYSSTIPARAESPSTCIQSYVKKILCAQQIHQISSVPFDPRLVLAQMAILGSLPNHREPDPNPYNTHCQLMPHCCHGARFGTSYPRSVSPIVLGHPWHPLESLSTVRWPKFTQTRSLLSS